MASDQLPARARALWERLAGVPVSNVALGGSARMAVPSENAALIVSDALGPARAGAVTVAQLLPDHPELRRLEEAAGQDDAGEAALDEITSPAFVVQEDARAVAAAGYRTWPGRTAHICVLTAPRARGRGLARVAGSAAVAPALAAGLLPQWRARPPASRRVAAALGFEELGAQLSLELA
ncbi:GNAT family N-acetyltransferase [Streptomyces sp. NPDC047081]|uniref:GNAT family N-acetyltransferase n=1 Tax=Streptomyces sp. NPDC047081 TaxID=3154706 RepID=UPI0033FFA141